MMEGSMWFRLVFLLALIAPAPHPVLAEPADKPFKVPADRVVPLDRGPRLIDLDGEATELLVFHIYAYGSAWPSASGRYSVQRIMAARPQGRPDLPWEAIRVANPRVRKQQVGSTSLWPVESVAAFFILDPRRPGSPPGLFVGRQINQGDPGWIEGEEFDSFNWIVKAGQAKAIHGERPCDTYMSRYWFERYRLRRQMNPETGQRAYLYMLDGRFRSRNFHCYISPDPVRDGIIEAFNYRRR
jgi:hypothetical protein